MPDRETCREEIFGHLRLRCAGVEDANIGSINAAYLPDAEQDGRAEDERKGMFLMIGRKLE